MQFKKSHAFYGLLILISSIKMGSKFLVKDLCKAIISDQNDINYPQIKFDNINNRFRYNSPSLLDYNSFSDLLLLSSSIAFIPN